MPLLPKRLRVAKHQLRTRLVMAGVMFGALLALGLSVTFSWGLGSGPAGRQDKAVQAAYQTPPGSCLMWGRPDASDIRPIDCAQPHLFEVTNVVNIGDKFPEGTPYPEVVQWQELTQERCGESASNYLGKPLDPYGKLTPSVLRLSKESWEDGERQVRCVLQWAGPAGGLQPLVGSAKQQQQSYVWELGTCLALLGKSVGDPIDCSQPHAYEIIAELDLSTKFTEGYPKQDEQKAWLDTECNKALYAYTGGVDAPQKLILSWDVREQESWNVGSTKINCKVGAKLEDNSGLAAVTGSIKKTPEPLHGSSQPTTPSGG